MKKLGVLFTAVSALIIQTCMAFADVVEHEPEPVEQGGTLLPVALIAGAVVVIVLVVAVIKKKK